MKIVGVEKLGIIRGINTLECAVIGKPLTSWWHHVQYNFIIVSAVLQFYKQEINIK